MSKQTNVQVVGRPAGRRKVGFKAFAVMCALALAGGVFSYSPKVGAPAETGLMAAPNATTPQPPSAPYYFPSQFELDAKEPAEPIQAF